MAPIGLTSRRLCAALAAAVFGTAAVPTAAAAFSAAPAAPASSADNKLPDGLYGTAKPTHDGVWRQSLALLAQNSQNIVPSASAIGLLIRQQCADGGFMAYRADTGKECDTGAEETNATAVAVQALAVLPGQREQVDAAVGWLRKVQNDDGGWGFNPGGPTDANSTSVVIGALAAAEEKPEAVKSAKGGSPYDGLAALQLGCDAAEGERGAYAYLPEEDGALYPNDYATAAAVLAGTGNGLAPQQVGGKDAPVAAGECVDDPAAASAAEAAEAGAGYLARQLGEGGEHLTAPTGDGPDHNATAVAAIALAAGGHRSAALEPYGWLKNDKSTAAWAKDDPAALATLVLAANAVGQDPRSFGATNLVAQLNSTGPEPAALQRATGGMTEEDDGGPDVVVWTLLGVGLVAGVGLGLLASARKKRQ